MDKRLKEILPVRIFDKISQLKNQYSIEEIRIRKDRQAYIISNGFNTYIDIIANDQEMNSILSKISHNSLYAFRDTIAEGYISFGYGLRIGIIGRASVENGKILGVYEINEFAIRLPKHIKVDCTELLQLANNSSMLIYASPGVGKTTLLRNLIINLAGYIYSKRVGVIDTRGELAYGLEDKKLLISILSGYPRREGIEIAVRTMNSQIIACDEIGNKTDADAIIDAQGAGVPIIATCHGSTISDIFSHTGIKKLHTARIFSYYIGITRTNEGQFNYTVHTWEEAQKYAF